MKKLTKIASVVLCSVTALSLVACKKKTTTAKATTTAVKTVETTKLTITFNTNGGNTIEAMKVPAGGSITMPSDPTKAGYTFDGWYESETFDGGTFNEKTMPNRNITLYAKWIALPTSVVGLTFNFTDMTIDLVGTDAEIAKVLADPEIGAGATTKEEWINIWTTRMSSMGTMSLSFLSDSACVYYEQGIKKNTTKYTIDSEGVVKFYDDENNQAYAFFGEGTTYKISNNYTTLTAKYFDVEGYAEIVMTISYSYAEAK